jgi:hypothetical protein
VSFLSNKSISFVIKSSYFLKSLPPTVCLYIRGSNGLVELDCAIKAKSSDGSLLKCVSSNYADNACFKG